MVGVDAGVEFVEEAVAVLGGGRGGLRGATGTTTAAGGGGCGGCRCRRDCLTGAVDVGVLLFAWAWAGDGGGGL